MRLIPALAALALALPAVAQNATKPVTTPAPATAPQKGTQANPAAPAAPAASNADSAKRAFDIATVNLQAAKEYVGGLNDLAQKPTTWDRTSSVTLFNAAQRAVTDAEEHIGQLVPFAKGDWAKASDALHKAQVDMGKAQGELKTFSTAVRAASGDPSSRQTSIKGLWDSLDSAAKNLNTAAGQMSVDTKLKTP